MALLAGGGGEQAISAEPHLALEKYAQSPLAFEKQARPRGERFVAHGQSFVIGLDGGKATMLLPPSNENTSRVVSLEFAGARSSRGVTASQLPGTVNYVRGNNPREWQLGLRTYARVTYSKIYPGIDVVYYGNQQQLEFDLVVKPGADLGAVRLKVGGARKLSIDSSGALTLSDRADGLRIALPQIYQQVQGKKTRVAGHYAIVSRDEVVFKVDRWDRTRALVIDPTITYSTMVDGGQGFGIAYGVKLDSSGNVLLAGYTYAADFPTLSAAQSGLKGGTNVFVSKINPAGTGLVYSTYLGGSSYDQAHGLAVDSTGSAWVTGYTTSTDFPVMNAVQPTFGGGGQDAFVAKLNAAGALQFSTFLGGTSSDTGSAIAVDGSGNGYVAGTSSGLFPTTAGVIQPANKGNSDAFVVKYGANGTIVYSTLLGGNSYDYGSGIAVDSAGSAYITGLTSSPAFTGAPPGGAQSSMNLSGDAFVAKLNATASALTYFTFLGGNGNDAGTGIAVDTSGSAYVVGVTGSAGLATVGAAQIGFGGTADGFIAKLNPSGTAFIYVSYLGGSRSDFPQGVAVDGSGDAYVTGYTNSADFPTASPIQPVLPGNGISLFNSTNSGSSWAAFDTNIPGAVADVSIHPSGASAVALTEAGIFRTVNGGASWTEQFPNLHNTGSVSTYLSRSPAVPGTIYSSDCCSV